MKFPGPREQLAGCVWLPRIIAKARMLQSGALPPEYASRFCHPSGVDGLFLAHFGLARENIIEAAALPDAKAAEWFTSQAAPERIQEWNRIAPNLGRPGFPMADRLPIALSTAYQNVDPRGISTVFEVLEADEKDL